MKKETHKKAPSLSDERKRELIAFLNSQNLPVSNLELFNLAFVHRSYANEFKVPIENNEKLEFLGDSILGAAVSHYLYENLPNDNEGDFSKIKSAVVSENSLDTVARKLGIDQLVLLGHGELLTGGRNKKAIIADCMEAIFAAIYLDCGFEVCKDFIQRLLAVQIQDYLTNKMSKDYKTLIQEYSQKRYKKCPVYELVGKEGPEHDKTFIVQMYLHGVKFGPAKGKTKKEAEQKVAEETFKYLKLDLQK